MKKPKLMFQWQKNQFLWTNMKRFLALSFCWVFSFCILNNAAFSLPENDKYVQFLKSINTIKASFDQIIYGQKPQKANGVIAAKKPDKIMLEHNAEEMEIKLVSVGNTLKIIDKKIGQTTYLDKGYAELMQVFTDKMDAKRLTHDPKRGVCMKFNYQEAGWESCLQIDLDKNTIKQMALYRLEVSKVDGKDIIGMAKIFDIFFKNVVINGTVSDSEFVIKDSRIFDEDD